MKQPCARGVVLVLVRYLGLKLTIIAHPNSRKPRIETDLLGVMHVYVSEPPLEGKANGAVVEALAKYYRVAKSNVVLLSGEKSKNKTIQIPD